MLDLFARFIKFVKQNDQNTGQDLPGLEKTYNNLLILMDY